MDKRTEPYQSGQQSNAKGDKGDKIKVKANVSKTRNAGQPDQLSQVLAGRNSYLPSGLHISIHTPISAPTGAHYNPAGEFGRPTSREGYKATNPMGRTGGKGTFKGKP